MMSLLEAPANAPRMLMAPPSPPPPPSAQGRQVGREESGRTRDTSHLFLHAGSTGTAIDCWHLWRPHRGTWAMGLALRWSHLCHPHDLGLGQGLRGDKLTSVCCPEGRKQAPVCYLTQEGSGLDLACSALGHEPRLSKGSGAFLSLSLACRGSVCHHWAGGHPEPPSSK